MAETPSGSHGYDDSPQFGDSSEGVGFGAAIGCSGESPSEQCGGTIICADAGTMGGSSSTPTASGGKAASGGRGEAGSSSGGSSAGSTIGGATAARTFKVLGEA